MAAAGRPLLRAAPRGSLAGGAVPFPPVAYPPALGAGPAGRTPRAPRRLRDAPRASAGGSRARDLLRPPPRPTSGCAARLVVPLAAWADDKGPGGRRRFPATACGPGPGPAAPLARLASRSPSRTWETVLKVAAGVGGVARRPRTRRGWRSPAGGFRVPAPGPAPPRAERLRAGPRAAGRRNDRGGKVANCHASAALKSSQSRNSRPVLEKLISRCIFSF